MTADKPKSRDAHHCNRVSCSKHRLSRNPAKLKHSPTMNSSPSSSTRPHEHYGPYLLLCKLQKFRVSESSENPRGRDRNREEGAQILQGLRVSSSRTKESMHPPVNQDIDRAIAGKAGSCRCAITLLMKTWRRRADLHET